MSTATTKTYTSADVAIARYAKALAHPARLAILRVLLERRACICGEIVEELPLSQSTVSQHLKELKASGLIKGEVEGKKVCYCIDAQEWQKAQQLLGGLFASYASFNGSCC